MAKEAAGFSFEIEIEGLSELQAKLEALPKRIARKVTRRALTAGADVIEPEVVRLAPREEEPRWPEYGHLQDNINTKVRMSQGGGKATISTGRAFWGRFQEFGEGPGPAQPFMRPAFDSKGQEALEAITEAFEQGIEEESD